MICDCGDSKFMGSGTCVGLGYASTGYVLAVDGSYNHCQCGKYWFIFEEEKLPYLPVGGEMVRPYPQGQSYIQVPVLSQGYHSLGNGLHSLSYEVSTCVADFSKFVFKSDDIPVFRNMLQATCPDCNQGLTALRFPEPCLLALPGEVIAKALTGYWRQCLCCGWCWIIVNPKSRQGLKLTELELPMHNDLYYFRVFGHIQNIEAAYSTFTAWVTPWKQEITLLNPTTFGSRE